MKQQLLTLDTERGNCVRDMLSSRPASMCLCMHVWVNVCLTRLSGERRPLVVVLVLVLIVFACLVLSCRPVMFFAVAFELSIQSARDLERERETRKGREGKGRGYQGQGEGARRQRETPSRDHEDGGEDCRARGPSHGDPAVRLRLCWTCWTCLRSP